MLESTLPRLRCPSCLEGNSGRLSLAAETRQRHDVLSGTLHCESCGSAFPIFGGVALLVGDVEHYLRLHVRGVAALVADDEIPEYLRDTYLEAKEQSPSDDEDLESERVNALYFATHYLRAKGKWWRPRTDFSPEIDRLVRACWDKGPFAKIEAWTRKQKKLDVVELGCGVGGLARVLQKRTASYLGFDTSFASIALARHVNLGAPYSLSLHLPQDLFHGPLTREVPLPMPLKGGLVDFVVAEIESPPVEKGAFSLAVALNLIDVIDDPAALPSIQHALLAEQGTAITSSPYLWNEPTVARLREFWPEAKNSAEAVAALYEAEGFTLSQEETHVPWLFLEHFRKLGLYSVHLFAARK